MLIKQMSFTNIYSTKCEVYWDKESNYYVVSGTGEMIQAEAENIHIIIDVVISQKEENEEVTFTKNSEFKKMLKRHAGFLVMKEEFVCAKEIIYMLENSETENQEESEKFIVAMINEELIAYNEKDYEKVVEANNYITPTFVRVFKSWSEAIEYINVNDTNESGGNTVLYGSIEKTSS